MPASPDATAIAMAVARAIPRPPTATDIATAIVGAAPNAADIEPPLLVLFLLLLPQQWQRPFVKHPRGQYPTIKYYRRSHSG